MYCNHVGGSCPTRSQHLLVVAGCSKRHRSGLLWRSASPAVSSSHVHHGPAPCSTPVAAVEPTVPSACVCCWRARLRNRRAAGRTAGAVVLHRITHCCSSSQAAHAFGCQGLGLLLKQTSTAVNNRQRMHGSQFSAALQLKQQHAQQQACWQFVQHLELVSAQILTGLVTLSAAI